MSENVIDDIVNGQMQTMDEISVNILSYSLPQNFSGQATFLVIAKNVETIDTFVCQASCAIKRGSGIATIVGDVVYSLPNQSDESMSTANASIGTSGSAVIVAISGVSMAKIDWLCTLEIKGIQSN